MSSENMQENDPLAEEFGETLSAAAAAVNAPASKHSAARIAELRRLYQSGEYRPSAQDIAKKLIDEHLS
jgi:anti-sigma28 factor (negative regulator of flagellin synthesis)